MKWKYYENRQKKETTIAHKIKVGRGFGQGDTN